MQQLTGGLLSDITLDTVIKNHPLIGPISSFLRISSENADQSRNENCFGDSWHCASGGNVEGEWSARVRTQRRLFCGKRLQRCPPLLPGVLGTSPERPAQKPLEQDDGVLQENHQSPTKGER